MSAGVPVLASNRGSLPEVIGNGGLLLEPDDVNGWASAIERVTTDASWARDLACAGLERAKAFTWDATAKRLGQAYREAVARHTRAAGRT
jgi:alpha-1,3-rhamnosyl/mannosyltransferase